MREVAVIGYAQSRMVRDAGDQTEVELLMPVLEEAISRAGLPRSDIDFICSGSCDYMAGSPFSFVMAVDALGATPCAQESHVEMDAAWALYEAWLKIQAGSIDTALIYGFGKSSPGALPEVMSQQLDPYYLAPLWPDTISVAALQANLMLTQGLLTEADMAQIVAQSRRNALDNPLAQLKGEFSVDQLLREPYIASPLRRHDCCPISDGCSAMVIATRDVAEAVCSRPAYLRGIEHRMEAHQLGIRDLTRSVSTEQAATKLKLQADRIDVAELYAPFSHQQWLLTRALGLEHGVDINPSGGVLAGHVMMAAGLDRIGEVARRIMRGEADRGLAHATSGPCLQHNLLAVMEGE